MPDDDARWRSTGRLLGLQSTVEGGMDADQQRLLSKKRGDDHGGWIGRRGLHGGGREEFWIEGSGIWNEEDGERWLGESGRGDPEGDSVEWRRRGGWIGLWLAIYILG